MTSQDESPRGVRAIPPSAIGLAALDRDVRPLREALLNHRLYERLGTMANLHVFLEHHVFAVWDFMSLLKKLQQELTCIRVPWRPVGDPPVRRLVNEIVLGEESDAVDGRAFSHLELYQDAMAECGADVGALERVLAGLDAEASSNAPELLRSSGTPVAAVRFVEDTFSIVDSGKLHAVAAAFAVGREALIPEMFRAIVAQLSLQFPGRLETLILYLDRHIALDGEVHSELAFRMLSTLCGGDPMRWSEARQAAVFALQSRLNLWNAVADLLPVR